jgi:NADH-quinone oxidoreductase subunit M
VGAILILALHNKSHSLQKALTIAILGLDLLLALWLWFSFSVPQDLPSIRAGMVFLVQYDWIPNFGVQFHLGVDGLSILLIMLTAFLAPIVMIGAWKEIQEKVTGFCVAILILQTGMLGTFMALDLFLFYIFWELMLIPMYFIVGIWGGQRRVYAAVKLVIFTMFGSLLMLIAILYIGTIYGSFNLLELYDRSFPPDAQHWLFAAFALSFAIKVPMFPLHTWLPDAHVEAPTPGSVILAGVLLKMGTYGFIRFAMPLFPVALETFTQPLMILAVFGIIYGALVAMVQPDVKKLVAYSSVSHLGFVMLGLLTLNIQGLQGGILQMVNHGLSTGALFLLVGMLYHRRHTRQIADYGGIARVVPIFAFFFLFITLSSIGLPGLNGFVGEFLILVGAFHSNKTYAMIAGLGIILGAVYMLWMYRRMMFGPINRAENYKIEDLDRREISILAVISVLCLWIGLAPNQFLAKTAPSVQALIKHIEKAHGVASNSQSLCAPQTQHTQNHTPYTQTNTRSKSLPMDCTKPNRVLPITNMRQQIPLSQTTTEQNIGTHTQLTAHSRSLRARPQPTIVLYNSIQP